jgi:hypothetical protein
MAGPVGQDRFFTTEEINFTIQATARAKLIAAVVLIATAILVCLLPNFLTLSLTLLTAYVNREVHVVSNNLVRLTGFSEDYLERLQVASKREKIDVIMNDAPIAHLLFCAFV